MSETQISNSEINNRFRNFVHKHYLNGTDLPKYLLDESIILSSKAFRTLGIDKNTSFGVPIIIFVSDKRPILFTSEGIVFKSYKTGTTVFRRWLELYAMEPEVAQSQDFLKIGVDFTKFSPKLPFKKATLISYVIYIIPPIILGYLISHVGGVVEFLLWIIFIAISFVYYLLNMLIVAVIYRKVQSTYKEYMTNRFFSKNPEAKNIIFIGDYDLTGEAVEYDFSDRLGGVISLIRNCITFKIRQSEKYSMAIRNNILK